jgi:hypothetical protein
MDLNKVNKTDKSEPVISRLAAMMLAQEFVDQGMGIIIDSSGDNFLVKNRGISDDGKEVVVTIFAKIVDD